MTDQDYNLRTWRYRSGDWEDFVFMGALLGVVLLVLFTAGFYLVSWSAR